MIEIKRATFTGLSYPEYSKEKGYYTTDVKIFDKEFNTIYHDEDYFIGNTLNEAILKFDKLKRDFWRVVGKPNERVKNYLYINKSAWVMLIEEKPVALVPGDKSKDLCLSLDNFEVFSNRSKYLEAFRDMKKKEILEELENIRKAEKKLVQRLNDLNELVWFNLKLS